MRRVLLAIAIFVTVLVAAAVVDVWSAAGRPGVIETGNVAKYLADYFCGW